MLRLSDFFDKASQPQAPSIVKSDHIIDACKNMEELSLFLNGRLPLYMTLGSETIDFIPLILPSNPYTTSLMNQYRDDVVVLCEGNNNILKEQDKQKISRFGLDMKRTGSELFRRLEKNIPLISLIMSYQKVIYSAG